MDKKAEDFFLLFSKIIEGLIKDIKNAESTDTIPRETLLQQIEVKELHINKLRSVIDNLILHIYKGTKSGINEFVPDEIELEMNRIIVYLAEMHIQKLKELEEKTR